MVGATYPGSRTLQRIRAARERGHQVSVIAVNREGTAYEDRPTLGERIRYRLRRPGDPADANGCLLEAAQSGCDLIWIENAAMIRPRTLQSVRRLAAAPRIAWYAEDDMMSRKHGSVWIDRSLP